VIESWETIFQVEGTFDGGGSTVWDRQNLAELGLKWGITKAD
jgi:hypothetical protein